MEAEKKSAMVSDVGAWAMNVVSSVGIILANKQLMSNNGYSFSFGNSIYLSIYLCGVACSPDLNLILFKFYFSMNAMLNLQQIIPFLSFIPLLNQFQCSSLTSNCGCMRAFLPIFRVTASTISVSWRCSIVRFGRFCD